MIILQSLVSKPSQQYARMVTTRRLTLTTSLINRTVMRTTAAMTRNLWYKMKLPRTSAWLSIKKWMKQFMKQTREEKIWIQVVPLNMRWGQESSLWLKNESTAHKNKPPLIFSTIVQAFTIAITWHPNSTEVVLPMKSKSQKFKFKNTQKVKSKKRTD